MLNISKQIYYGWNSKTSKYPLPEVEIMPGGESSTEKKRIEKASSKFTELKEYDNNPLPGFTLFKTNRKKYGSADPTWLIIDPRGFLARITNENLEEILDVTGITEGLIQERCVWAREDTQSKLTLIPISSPTYIEAVNNTELLDNKVSLKDVQIGDSVLLQSGLTGTYMGVLSLYGPIAEYNLSYKAQANIRRQVLKVEDGKYHYQANIKILKVITKTDNPLTKEESAELLNKDIETNPSTYFTNTDDVTRGYYSSRNMVKFVSANHVNNVPIELAEITYNEAVLLFDRANNISDNGMMVCEKENGQKYLIDFPYSITARSLKPESFNATKVSWSPDRPDELTTTKEERNFGYYSRTVTRELHALDKFAKFYTIVKHVKNKSYV